MAALGAHTLRTQTIPKGPKPIAARPGFVGWKLEKFDILKGAQNSFPLIPDWFLAGVLAGGNR